MARLRRFYGEIPRENRANLPFGYACEARDVKLWHGVLEPFQHPKEVCDLDSDPCVVYRADCCWVGSCDPCAVFTRVASCGQQIKSEKGQAPQVLRSTQSDGCACADEWCPLGIPVPQGQPELSGPQSCTEHGTMRRYVFTFSRKDCFAEGAPGAMTNVVVMDSCDTTANIIGIPQPPSDACVDTINIYRLESTWDHEKGFKQAEGGDLQHSAYFDVNTQSDYFLVASVPVGTVAIADSLDSDQLGRTLMTWGFFPPPENLRIVGETDNGSLVGFVDNILWFSERNAHHAWPTKTRINLDHKIRRAVVSGSDVFVATTGRPYVIDDSSAECKDATCRQVMPATRLAPICSERSMVVWEGSAYWATAHAFVKMDRTGVIENISDRYWAQDDWMNLEPNTARAVIWNDMLWLTTDRFSGYVDLRDSEQPVGVVELTIAPVQWIVDEANDLYFLAGEGKIFKWDAAPEIMTYRWRSGLHVMDGAIRISAAKVVFDMACGNEPLGRRTGFSMFVDGRHAFQRQVNRSAPFKMKQMRGINYCVAVMSQDVIREIDYDVNIRALARGQ